jgi:archaemetzincin
VNTVYVLPLGQVPAQVLEWIDGIVAEWLPMPSQRLGAVPVPQAAYDAKRGQYQSTEIMRAIANHAPGDACRVLGVTEMDLAIPTLTFLFGQAQLDGAVALVSLARLRQEFYGLPADEALLRERVAKEVLHELGHTFGLTHCHDPKCAMSLSTHVGLVDAKDESYCTNCGIRLARKASTLMEKAHEEGMADSGSR